MRNTKVLKGVIAISVLGALCCNFVGAVKAEEAQEVPANDTTASGTTSEQNVDKVQGENNGAGEENKTQEGAVEGVNGENKTEGIPEDPGIPIDGSTPGATGTEGSTGTGANGSTTTDQTGTNPAIDTTGVTSNENSNAGIMPINDTPVDAMQPDGQIPVQVPGQTTTTSSQQSGVNTNVILIVIFVISFALILAVIILSKK